MPLPPVAERFLRYVRIDTRSDPASHTVPSTEAQKTLGRLLRDELRAMGAAEVVMDPHGYVFATIPATSPEAALPVLALLAHQDTSPDAPGADVRPVIHASYDGGVLRLPGDERVVLDPARQPALRDHLGHDVITSDGTTLLGSDDKAGVAILMQLAEDLLADHTLPCPRLRLCFTVDEEIGRGVDHLDLAVLGADVAYTLDGSGTDTLYSETFNAAEALVTVEGIMVHPGYAHGIMVNAARILSDLIAALPPDEAPETTSGRAGYFHPHTLDAADAARARARILLRDFTDAGLLRRKNFVHAHAEALRLRYPKARITVEIHDQYRNMRRYIEETDPRTVSFAHAAAREMGITLTDRLVRGGTDGARLSERGLPTPNVFTGGHDFHSLFEWNTVQNLERALAYTRTLVRYWAEHGHDDHADA